MTINTVNCEYFSDRLMAYLEHETDDATRATLERHALGCAECGALLADLRRLRIEATNLPELTPSRDLWSGIAARIEAPVVPIGTVRQSEEQRSHRVRRWMRRALAAASLVAAAGVGYFAARAGTTPVVTLGGPVAEFVDTLRPAVISPESAPGTSTVAVAASRTRVAEPSATRTAGATPVRQVSVDRAYTTLVADYDREIARLRVLIDQRRNQLDPVTVAIIEKNMQVIDSAIAECKKAIARDPASRFLIESLNQSLQTKVELMRTAALLPTRT